MHRNTVYGHEQWHRHKSSWRHGRHLFTVLSSRDIVAHLALPVCFATLIAIFVAVFNHGVECGAFGSSVPLLRVASLPFLVTSPVLALLLVFRTNASYGRFEEARKIWGMSVIKTRDFVRQALSWIRSPVDAGRVECLVRHVKAYSFALKDHLTEGDTLRAELEGVLEAYEIESVMNSAHRPNYIMQVMSEIIACVEVSEWEKITLDGSISVFHYNAGACERIFNTPIPVAFTRLTSRFLIVWHCALPFGLWDVCGWMTIPVAFFSALSLFYIEEVGVLIEEPFWVLALEAYSRGISASLDGITAAHRDICQSKHHSLRSSKEHVVITFEGSNRDITTPAFSTCLWDGRVQDSSDFSKPSVDVSKVSVDSTPLFCSETRKYPSCRGGAQS
ncbi:hypothetical protein M758_11G050500 [Ceratodon purpureus]|nr:hypothetical protein M758_11G050500 [Ceratodon purpureus]